MPVTPEQLEKAGIDVTVALRLMKAAADDAEAAGDRFKADGLRREMCEIEVATMTKLTAGRPSRWGPGVTPLLKERQSRQLPPDTQLHGI
jgi:hypothetical protein